IIANATSGTTTIEANSVAYGYNPADGAMTGAGGTITVTNAGATLAITGPLDTRAVNVGTRIVVHGAGTIDLPPSQDGKFNKSFQIGTVGAAGPTLNLHSVFNLGGNDTDQTFFDSGTIKNVSGGFLLFDTNIRQSIGGTGGFPSTYAGNDME